VPVILLSPKARFDDITGGFCNSLFTLQELRGERL